jgi:small subunit ribosomal protein S16
MARGGARNRPFYNIVVADSRDPRDGRFIERIGFWNPKAPEGSERVRIALDRIEHWVARGAKPSDAVMRLAKQQKKQVVAPAA